MFCFFMFQTDDMQSTQFGPSQLLYFTCTDGWIQQVEEDRAENRTTAIQKIRSEKKTPQKKYDRKLKRNR